MFIQSTYFNINTNYKMCLLVFGNSNGNYKSKHVILLNYGQHKNLKQDTFMYRQTQNSYFRIETRLLE